jgi:hypothetical protein
MALPSPASESSVRGELRSEGRELADSPAIRRYAHGHD